MWEVDIVLSILITILIYTIPIVIYKAIINKPVASRKAKIITIFYAVFAFCLMAVTKSALGQPNAPSVYPLTLWSFVNYYILVSKKYFVTNDNEYDEGKNKTVTSTSQNENSFEKTLPVRKDTSVKAFYDASHSASDWGNDKRTMSLEQVDVDLDMEFENYKKFVLDREASSATFPNKIYKSVQPSEVYGQVQDSKKNNTVKIVMVFAILFCVLVIGCLGIPYIKKYTELNLGGAKESVLDAQDETLGEEGYESAVVAYKSGNYKDAYLMLCKTDIEDSELIRIISGYHYAKELIEDEAFDDAVKVLKKVRHDLVNDKYKHKKSYKVSHEMEGIKSSVSLDKVNSLISESYSEQFLVLYENKEYLAAFKAYDKSNHDKYKEKYQSCVKHVGNDFLDNKEYELAVNFFEKCENQESIYSELHEAKYGYIKDHFDSRDNTTIRFLVDLVESNYKDSEELYKELDTIKASIVINNDGSDNSLETVSKWDTIYFSYELEGGITSENRAIYYKIYWPDGDVSTGEDSMNAYHGWGEVNYSFDEPQYAETGTVVFVLYDKDWSEIGRESVTIED